MKLIVACMVALVVFLLGWGFLWSQEDQATRAKPAASTVQLGGCRTDVFVVFVVEGNGEILWMPPSVPGSVFRTAYLCIPGDDGQTCADVIAEAARKAHR